MESPSIALVVDNPQRDLAGLVLLGYELCQRGARCFLVPASLRAREIYALAPDFVLLHNLRTTSQQLVRSCREAGIVYGVLDTEGGIWPTLSDYTSQLLPEPVLRGDVARVCAWGARLGEHLVDAGYFGPAQVAVTGCPRFDFLHPTWRAALDLGAGAAHAGPPRILVIANYSEANPRFYSPAYVLEELTTLFHYTRAEALALVATQQQALEATIALALRLAADLPQTQVVFRPHPFEATAVYAERLGGVPNIELNFHGPVTAQIGRAAAVVQRTSTTAVEAALAGVPALLPLWVPAAAPMPIIEAVSLACADYAALRQAIADVLDGDYRLPSATAQAIAGVTNDWFYRADGQSYRRVADTIFASLCGARQVDLASCRRALYGLDGSGSAGLARLLRYQLHLSPDWSFRRMRPDPETSWAASDRGFDAAMVAGLSAQIGVQYESSVGRPRAVRVAAAGVAGAYRHAYVGHSVTMAA